MKKQFRKRQFEKVGRSIIDLSEKIEKKFLVRVIRDGLVTMIPILMIGGFALILQTLPIEFYQQFIGSFANGLFDKIFTFAYKSTFGVMSVYMTVAFSVSFFQTKDPLKGASACGVISSLVCFMILVGMTSPDFSFDSLGADSVFLAMCTAILGSFLYDFFDNKIGRKLQSYSYGVDSRLNGAMNAFFPALITIAISTAIAYLVVLTGNQTMYKLIIKGFNILFSNSKSIFGAGLGFIFLSSFLWLFGIHGSNTLQGVSTEYFVPLLSQNIAAVENGEVPTEILSKQFFDCFILMGGCGSCICLLIAILAFSRDKGMKDIARSAMFPMIFNINELMVFGLPIVFNPIMVIPFLLVPVTQYLVAYFATLWGLVPVITASVEWTTPVILGGFWATGSVAGSILQIVNIAIGVAIYTPFVRMMVRVREERGQANREAFIHWYKENENDLVKEKLTDIRGVFGEIAKKITLDLKNAISEKHYALFYQPQYDYDNHCIGVEALLRWPTISSLAIYPPILIQLAEECGMLETLEEGILELAMKDREDVFRQFGDNIKISVNVTGLTIGKDEYWNHLKEIYAADPFTNGKLCIEITEKTAISLDEKMLTNFKETREMGIMFAVDDFSVGQTSVNYLKEGMFDLLKIDGSLVRSMNTNERCTEIVASLVTLANSLGIMVLAEYVETEALREKLHEVGCNVYQGYYYSPAVPLKR